MQKEYRLKPIWGRYKTISSNQESEMVFSNASNILFIRFANILSNYSKTRHKP